MRSHINFMPDISITQSLYNKLSWFTSVRLFFVRLNRLLKLVCRSFMGSLGSIVHGKAHIPMKQLAAASSLSYGLELLIDIGVIFKTTFFPSKKEKIENPSVLSRFKNIIHKDDRPSRMRNAAVWFGVNLACLFLTAGVSAIVNSGLFLFDLVHDIYKSDRHQAKYQRLLGDVNHNLVMAEEELENANTTPEKNKLNKQIEKYKKMRRTLLRQQIAISKEKNYAILVSATILFGMLLFFFPPAGLLGLGVSLLALKVTGAAIALSGSVFGGFGRRTYKNMVATCNTMLEESKKDSSKLSCSASSTCLIHQSIKRRVPVPNISLHPITIRDGRGRPVSPRTRKEYLDNSPKSSFVNSNISEEKQDGLEVPLLSPQKKPGLIIDHLRMHGLNRGGDGPQKQEEKGPVFKLPISPFSPSYNNY